jgi:hypothetical protein
VLGSSGTDYPFCPSFSEQTPISHESIQKETKNQHQQALQRRSELFALLPKDVHRWTQSKHGSCCGSVWGSSLVFFSWQKSAPMHALLSFFPFGRKNLLRLDCNT